MLKARKERRPGGREVVSAWDRYTRLIAKKEKLTAMTRT